MSDNVTIRVRADLRGTRALEDFLQHFAMLGYAPIAWGDVCEDTGSALLHFARIPARQQALEVCNGFIWAHEAAV